MHFLFMNSYDEVRFLIRMEKLRCNFYSCRNLVLCIKRFLIFFLLKANLHSLVAKLTDLDAMFDSIYQA